MTEILHTLLDEQADHQKSHPNYALRRGIALSGVALSLVGGVAAFKAGEHVVDRIVTPIEYSEETTTYTVQENEGLNAVTGNVAGINTVDFSLVQDHLRTIPENITALSDGIQLHETFIIPVEVKKR